MNLKKQFVGRPLLLYNRHSCTISVYKNIIAEWYPLRSCLLRKIDNSCNVSLYSLKLVVTCSLQCKIRCQARSKKYVKTFKLWKDRINHWNGMLALVVAVAVETTLLRSIFWNLFRKATFENSFFNIKKHKKYLKMRYFSNNKEKKLSTE